jgi:hypothetical protein
MINFFVNVITTILNYCHQINELINQVFEKIKSFVYFNHLNYSLIRSSFEFF